MARVARALCRRAARIGLPFARDPQSRRRTMLGRSSRSALSDRPAVQAGAAVIGRTAETIAELAEKAASAAREAQRAATPALRGAAQTSAESLSHAAERAAEVLADVAQRLAQAVPAPESAAAEERK